MHLFHIVWFCVEHVLNTEPSIFVLQYQNIRQDVFFQHLVWIGNNNAIGIKKNPTRIVRVHLLIITNLCMNEKKVNPKPERV